MKKNQAVLAAAAVALVVRNFVAPFEQILIGARIPAGTPRLIAGTGLEGAIAMALAVRWIKAIAENMKPVDVTAAALGFGLFTTVPWILGYLFAWSPMSSWWVVLAYVEALAVYTAVGALAGNLVLRAGRDRTPRRGRPVRAD